MSRDGPPIRPSSALCSSRAATLGLTLPAAQRPPPHTTTRHEAVRRGKRGGGRGGRNESEEEPRSNEEHAAAPHCPHAHHTTHTACLPPSERAQEPRHDSAKMVQQCHEWDNATHGRREAQRTRGEHKQTARRTIRRTRHTRVRFRPPRERHHHQPHRCTTIAAARNAPSHPPESENKRYTWRSRHAAQRGRRRHQRTTPHSQTILTVCPPRIAHARPTYPGRNVGRTAARRAAPHQLGSPVGGATFHWR